MGYQHPPARVTVTSNVAAARSSKPVHIGGQEFSVWITGPAAALVSVAVSEDQVNWVTASLKDTAAAASGLTPFTDVEIRELPTWARLTIAIDAAAPQLFTATFHVKELTS